MHWFQDLMPAQLLDDDDDDDDDDHDNDGGKGIQTSKPQLAFLG